MGIALFGSLGDLFNTSTLGSVWRPKQSGIRVGRDVGAMTATAFSGGAEHKKILGHGDDVTVKSNTIFALAKSAAAAGGRAKHFRSVTDEDLAENSLSENNVLGRKGDFLVTYSEDMVGIHKKNAETGKYELVSSFKPTDDTRIVWNDADEPQVLTGGQARESGVLAAQGADEILIRVSGASVKAGAGSTVLNLSSQAGEFTGGTGVTYLGAYNGDAFRNVGGGADFAGLFSGIAFEDFKGTASFSGVFENVAIKSETGYGKYSGYFSNSSIAAGDDGNTLNGMFLSTAVTGGQGNDVFNGRFVSSTVDGGEGDDSFGYGIQAKGTLLTERVVNGVNTIVSYEGVEADFVNSSVETGGGDDSFDGVMWGGVLNLSEGENTTNGVFAEAVINGGDGDDTLSAAHSNNSIFNTGSGKDTVDLITAVQSTVNTGEGVNNVTMGRNGLENSEARWQTRDEHFSDKRSTEAGEVRENTVNAALGESSVIVHNGESHRDFFTRDTHAPEKDGSAPEAESDASSSPSKAHSSPENAHDQRLRRHDKDGRDGRLDKDDRHGPRAGKNERHRRQAIERYLAAYGTEPRNPGEVAATVSAGPDRSEIVHGVERKERQNYSEPPGMIRTMRRYDGFGAYSWQRWSRLP